MVKEVTTYLQYIADITYPHPILIPHAKSHPWDIFLNKTILVVHHCDRAIQLVGCQNEKVRRLKRELEMIEAEG